MAAFYHMVFYNPLYNGIIFLLSLSPGWVDMGAVVIIFTILVKLMLFPLSKASIKTQIRMKELEPKMAELKLKYKNDAKELSKHTMDLYKEYKLNPLSGVLLLLIQLPIIIALYSIFRTAGLPSVNTALLYPFVHVPSHINTYFLSFDITQKSIILALVAAVSQFFQVKFSIPAIKVDEKKSGQKDFKDDLMRSMNLQMRYVLPAFVFFVAWSVNAAVALYWTTSNLFAIGQEIFVRRKLVNEANDKLKASLIIK